MMDTPLEEQYFEWLYSQVASVNLRNPAVTFWSLLRQCHDTTFVWTVPNDDNRVEDGRDLRIAFLTDRELTHDATWLGPNCSMLELLLGLSHRLSFEAEGEPAFWFWHLLGNLNLQDFSDAHYRNEFTRDIVNQVLTQVIERTYGFDGNGGLFPLANPREDQRHVELWYQLCAYVLERT